VSLVAASPTPTLRVLLVEDRPEDADLVMRELSQAGFDIKATRVDTEAALLEALQAGPDVVLTDYALPQYSARDAISTVRLHAPDVPVVVVSGAIGEETAVECLRLGADDYLLKDRLGRLPSAVRRALDDRALIRATRLADEDRRATQDRLRRVQKLESLARLAGGIAHEFNNLFTGVLGYAQLLLEDLEAGDPRRNDVVAIRESIDRAVGLTRRLVAFSARDLTSPAWVAVNDVVAAVVAGLGVERPTTTIELQLAPTPELVSVDRAQLEEVVRDLMFNACDAMAGAGTIVVRTAACDAPPASCPALSSGPPASRYVALSVSDHGVGMSSEVQASLFEPFFTTKPDSMGLGLAVTYGVVKQYRGHIDVKSAVGRGTTVTLYLPACAEPCASGGDPTEHP